MSRCPRRTSTDEVHSPTVAEILAFPLALTERLPPRVLDHLLDASQGKRGGTWAPREPSYACSSLEVLKRLVAQFDVVAPFTMSLIRDDMTAARLVALPAFLSHKVPAGPEILALEDGDVGASNANGRPS